MNFFMLKVYKQTSKSVLPRCKIIRMKRKLELTNASSATLTSASSILTQTESSNSEERAAIIPPLPAALITATAHSPSHISPNTPVVMWRWPVLRLTGPLSKDSLFTVARHSCVICWWSAVYGNPCNLNCDWGKLSAYILATYMVGSFLVQTKS